MKPPPEGDTPLGWDRHLAAKSYFSHWGIDVPRSIIDESVLRALAGDELSTIQEVLGEATGLGWAREARNVLVVLRPEQDVNAYAWESRGNGRLVVVTTALRRALIAVSGLLVAFIEELRRGSFADDSIMRSLPAPRSLEDLEWAEIASRTIGKDLAQRGMFGVATSIWLERARAVSAGAPLILGESGMPAAAESYVRAVYIGGMHFVLAHELSHQFLGHTSSTAQPVAGFLAAINEWLAGSYLVDASSKDRVEMERSADLAAHAWIALSQNRMDPTAGTLASVGGAITALSALSCFPKPLGATMPGTAIREIDTIGQMTHPPIAERVSVALGLSARSWDGRDGLRGPSLGRSLSFGLQLTAGAAFIEEAMRNIVNN